MLAERQPLVPKGGINGTTNLGTPPEPFPPPIREPKRDPEDPHAPLEAPDGDPTGQPQI
jgi:hypothetical protein